MTKPDFITLVAPERKRTYLFPNNQTIIFENISAVAVSKSGTHRLNMADGTKAIVPTGWLAILLDMDEWTF